MLHQLKQLFFRYFSQIRWYNLIAVVASYIVISAGLLMLSGESILLRDPTTFVYFLVVTASTVGYGDFSPTTDAGHWVVALWVIPMGLGLFGLVVGRMAASVAEHWRKGLRGLKKVDWQNHIVIIGWNEQRTLEMIHLLQQEVAQQKPSPGLLLCVRENMENPMPGSLAFVRVSNFTSDVEMERAAIAHAGTIIIDHAGDEATLTTALYCQAQNPNAHTIAYFENASVGELLRQHCPSVECMPSVAIEMMAKSAVDPGSSRLHHQLLSSAFGMTQYSTVYTGSRPTTVADIFAQLKENFNATLIGLSSNGGGMELNPPLDRVIEPEDRLYYIASQRVHEFTW